MDKVNYSKGNEKIVFYLQHPNEVNDDIDESYIGYVVIYLTVTMCFKSTCLSESSRNKPKDDIQI